MGIRSAERPCEFIANKYSNSNFAAYRSCVNAYNGCDCDAHT